MEKQDKHIGIEYTIDVLHIFRALWKRAWIIAVCGILAAAIGFSLAAFFIAPKYSSYVSLYVNNSSSNASISASDLTAAQSLVKTYGEILNSRTTLERVIEKADVDYTRKELSDMIRYSSSNKTEILKVTVTCKDPEEACRIANAIADVLPLRITEIIEGTSMEIVDSAVIDNEKVSPGIIKYTAVGLLAGLFLSVAVLTILALLDDTIHSEEYILKAYSYPILGRIPDLTSHEVSFARQAKKPDVIHSSKKKEERK